MLLLRGGDSINLEQPNSKTRRGRIGKQIANTLTCSCNQGVVIEVNKIIREIIPQQVRVRKYEVDIDNLKSTLRLNKKKSQLTNKQISEKLNQPLTLVEHWFRSDNCFSIPSEDIWFNLKELLNIETNKFDESIMEFEVRDGVFDKANRVYDSNGIAPTLTCVNAENERYKVYEEILEEDFMSEPKLVGGIGEINFGKQYRQGNRIYDSEEIAMCLMAQPVGNAGGYSYLYKVKNIKEGGYNMWKNELKKYKFDMEELRVFDVFAGVGALHDSLKRLGVPIKIKNLSEIDIDATITYAAYHIDGFKDLEFEYPSDDEMKQWLMDRNIGYSYEKGKSSVPRMKKDKLRLAYKASKLLNNLGDISKINYEDIEDFDMFNLSFPCTDISGSGKQKGMTNEDGTPTRSGLVTYGIQAIKAKRPKYIMIENVKALVQKKFISDFYSIINEIESYGYKCYYPIKNDSKNNNIPLCLNAKNYGIPQNRERIYVICVRNDIEDGISDFPLGSDDGTRLKDVLEKFVDDKYYINKANNMHMKENYIQYDNSGKGYESQAARLYYADSNMGSLPARNAGDKTQIVENSKNQLNKDVVDNSDYNNSLFKIRKLTPLECMRLMGFEDKIYYNAKELGMSDSALYKQAGNSIVVNCLYYIFKELFKNYIVE